MRSEQPPALAHWLLKYFGCGPNNDAVVGDLASEPSDRRQPMQRPWERKSPCTYTHLN